MNSYDEHEGDEEIFTRDENLIVNKVAPQEMGELCSSIGLLSIEVLVNNEEQKSFGTVFLCDLGPTMGNEAALLSAGHNFITNEGKSVLDDGYPFHRFEIAFRKFKRPLFFCFLFGVMLHVRSFVVSKMILVFRITVLTCVLFLTSVRTSEIK